MRAPANMAALTGALIARGDAYLALPAYGAEGAEWAQAALARLLLTNARLKLVFAALPFAPPAFLALLAGEDRPAILQRIVRNPATSGATLLRLARQMDDAATRAALALSL
ncbi:hypothetical protein LJE71_03370, partial [Xanthobacter autotrophicus]|uniref:hypothetical protein n=1 Tax=Xanthobacter autotrophicus TaxID=280 RepID=UPI001E4807E1